MLGRPRLHLRATASTNERAKALAAAGAPHGTLVTAGEQTAGRGRQGRAWSSPAGRSLSASLVLRRPPALLSLRAGLAVVDVVGEGAAVKWPNDVLLDGRKVAGMLVERRAGEDWAVLGVGVNVAVRPQDLPVEVRDRAGTLGRPPEAVEEVLAAVLERLGAWLGEPNAQVVAALRARDALAGRRVTWAGGEGVAAGIGADGALLVRTTAGEVALDGGEVHLLA